MIMCIITSNCEDNANPRNTKFHTFFGSLEIWPFIFMLTIYRVVLSIVVCVDVAYKNVESPCQI